MSWFREMPCEETLKIGIAPSSFVSRARERRTTLKVRYARIHVLVAVNENLGLMLRSIRIRPAKRIMVVQGESNRLGPTLINRGTETPVTKANRQADVSTSERLPQD
jgi:hypothetical protein